MLKEVTIDIGKVTPNQFIETLETIVLGSVNMSFERAKQVFRNAGEVYLGVQYAFENKDKYDLLEQTEFWWLSSAFSFEWAKGRGGKYFVHPKLLPYYSTISWNDMSIKEKWASSGGDISAILLEIGGLGITSAVKTAIVQTSKKLLKEGLKSGLKTGIKETYNVGKLAVSEFKTLTFFAGTATVVISIVNSGGKCCDKWAETFKNDAETEGFIKACKNKIDSILKWVINLLKDIVDTLKQSILNVAYKTFGSPVNTTLAYMVDDAKPNAIALDLGAKYLSKNDIRKKVRDVFRWITLNGLKENISTTTYIQVLKNLKEYDTIQYDIIVNDILNNLSALNSFVKIVIEHIGYEKTPNDLEKFLKSEGLDEFISKAVTQYKNNEKAFDDEYTRKKIAELTFKDEKVKELDTTMTQLYTTSNGNELATKLKEANDTFSKSGSEKDKAKIESLTKVSSFKFASGLGIASLRDTYLDLKQKRYITSEAIKKIDEENLSLYNVMSEKGIRKTLTGISTSQPVLASAPVQSTITNIAITSSGSLNSTQISQMPKNLPSNPLDSKKSAKFKEAGIGQYYTTDKIDLEGLEGYDPSINYFNYTGTLENEKVALGGLDPNLRSNLNAMGYEFFVKFNRKFKLTSAFRSYATQEKLWKDYKAGKGNPANRPGYSLHEFGLAVDILSSDAALLDNSGLLKKWGFWRPLAPNPEAWHIQPISIKQKNGDGQVEVQEEKIEKNLEEKGEIESLEEKYNNIVNDPNASKTEKEVAEKKLKELENKKVVEQGKTPPTIVTESISGIDPTLINHIKAHEGFRENIYVENFAGKPNPTVGYGFLVSALTADELALNGGKAEPMSKEVAEKILTLKVSKLIKNMDKYGKLGEVYKKAPQQIKNFLVDFAYSIGPAGANGFPRMLAAIEKGDYQTAINELKYSDPNTKTPSKISQQVSSIMFNNWISVLAGQKTYADLKMIKEDGKTLPKVANVDTTSPNVKTEGINSLPKVANVDTTSPNVKVSEPTTIFSGEVGESVEQVYSQVADELGLNKTAIETLKIEEIKEEVYRDTIKKKVNNVKQKVNSEIKKSSATTPLVRTSDGNYVFNKNAKLGLDTKTGSLTFSDVKDYNSVNTAFENNIQKEMEQAISEYNVSDLHLGSSNTNVQQVIDDNTNFYKSQYEDLSSTQENIQVQNIQKISENNTLNKYKEVSQGFNNGATNASILDGLLPFDATNESERINA